MKTLFDPSPFAQRAQDIEIAPPARAQKPYSHRLRMRVAAGAFLFAFAALGVRMSAIALDQQAPRVEQPPNPKDQETSNRAQLLDRNGRLIGTTLQTWEVFIHPRDSISAGGISPDDIEALGLIFPQLDLIGLRQQLNDGKKSFMWIARRRRRHSGSGRAIWGLSVFLRGRERTGSIHRADLLRISSAALMLITAAWRVSKRA